MAAEKRHIEGLLGFFTFNLLIIAAVLLIPDFTAFAGSREAERNLALLIKEVPLTQSYRDAGAVVLLKEGRMKVEKGGVFTLTIRVVVKVLDEKAASDYSQISVYYNSHYDEATLLLARTIKEDGTVRTVSSDAVQVKTSPRGKEYSDTRFLTFSLPALERGSVLEYEVKIQRKVPLIENKWSESMDFQYYHYNDNSIRIDPAYKSKFVLEVPDDEPFLFETQNVKITPAISRRPPLLLYTWEAGHFPAIPVERFMPPLNEILPSVHVSSIRAWDEVARWAGRLFLPATEVTPEIQGKALEIIQGAKTEEEKIAAIFYFVESHIKYVAADLNRGGFKPHPAHEVLKNQYGDCKDQTVLSITLLKSVGIAAHPALIRANVNHEIDTRVPSLDFDHAIVYIPREKGSLWLDTTSGVTRFPNLSWPCQNKWALVVDGEKGKLVKTASSRSEDNESEMNMDIVFKDSIINYDVTIKAGGAHGDLLKGMMKTLSSDRQKEVISEFYRGSSVPSQVRIVEIADVADPRLPFKTVVHIEFVDDQIQKAPSYSTTFSLKPLLRFFTSLGTLPQPQDRKNSYRFYFPYRLVGEGVCSPPREGMKPLHLPKKQLIETPFFTFNAEYVRKGDSVQLKQILKIRETQISKDQYKQFYDSVQEVLKKSEGVINFTYRKEDKQGIEIEEAVRKEPNNPKALLELGKNYLRSGRYKEARETLDKCVLLEPNNGEPHYFLGIALGYLDFLEDSKKELKKAKELGY